MANGTYGLNAIKTAINNKSTSAVKSIQRGVMTINSSTTAKTYSGTVTISTINPSKSIVLLNGTSAEIYYSGYGEYQPYVTALTANSLTLKTYGDYRSANETLEFSWCVVEFN